MISQGLLITYPINVYKVYPMTRKQHPNRNAQQDKSGHGKVKNVTKESGRVVKEKFQEERSRKVIPLCAKNDNQKITLRAFLSKQLIAQVGSAGTGKTELACWWASKQWLEGQIDNIVITRPYKHLGTDYGATKGNDAEKLLPFCMSMLMKLKKYLGVGILRSNFRTDAFDDIFKEADGIQIVPVEKIQGMSFSNRTIIIADEVQNMTIAQVKALVTRAEEGCQILITGDTCQSAIQGGRDGLSYLAGVMERHPHELSQVITYTPADNCRVGISGHFTALFEKDGQW